MVILPTQYHRRIIGDRVYYINQLLRPNLIHVSEDADELLTMIEGPTNSDILYERLKDRIPERGELEEFLEQCVGLGLLGSTRLASMRMSTNMATGDADEESQELERYSIETRIPIGGSIELTTRCNLKCIHCYLGDERTKQTSTDLEQWLDYIEQVIARGCVWVEVTGGDPLLSPFFVPVYRKLVESGAVVTVLTNGTTITPTHLELFSELPPAKIELSIYGSTREVYEGVTGVAGSYKRFLEGAKSLASIGANLEIKAILLKLNVHQLPEMRQFSEEVGAFFRFSGEIHEELNGSKHPNEHRLDPETVAATDFSDLERAREIKEVFQKRHPIKSMDAYQCRAGVNGFHIAPTGLVHPCITERSIGFSLETHSFGEIWDVRLPEAMSIRYKGNEKCALCELYSMCKICPARARMATSDPLASVSYLCALAKERRKLTRGGDNHETQDYTRC